MCVRRASLARAVWEGNHLRWSPQCRSRQRASDYTTNCSRCQAPFRLFLSITGSEGPPQCAKNSGKPVEHRRVLSLSYPLDCMPKAFAHLIELLRELVDFI